MVLAGLSEDDGSAKTLQTSLTESCQLKCAIRIDVAPEIMKQPRHEARVRQFETKEVVWHPLPTYHASYKRSRSSSPG